MKVPLLISSLRLGALLIAAAATPLLAQAPPAAGAKLAAPKLIVARDTTYFTEPLDADGNVDFVAAINRRISAGITPENNAAVPFWRACGPPKIDPTARAEYFRLLGSDVPASDGKQYRSLHQLLDSRPEWTEFYLQADSQAEMRAWKTPWTKKSYPWLVPWIEEHDAALTTLVAASRRPQFFDPVVMLDPYWGLGGTWAGPQLELYGIGRLLVTRAMYRAGSGDLDGACDDLEAAHRIGGLCGRGWNELAAVSALSFQVSVGDAALSLLELPGLKQAHVRRLRSDRRAAPAMPPLVELIDVGDRISSLDLALTVRRNGMGPLIELTQMTADIFNTDSALYSGEKQDPQERRKARVDTIVDRWLKNSVDWNLVLKEINRRYDDLALLLRKPHPVRRERIADLLKKTGESPPGLQIRPPNLRIPTPEQSVEAAAQLILMYHYRTLLAQFDSSVRAEAQRRLHDLAFDLAEYRLLNGKYPDRLADLESIEGAGSRIDPFTEREFTYRKTEKGYLLYGPGPNLRDDGGRTPDDAHKVALAKTADKPQANLKEFKPDWDDVAVRMPHQSE